MTDINVKTLTYIKNCNKQKNSRNIQMTCRYPKENKLVAIPFDKGIGVCLMTVDTYNNKLKDIISLPQFEKVLPKRKNEKHLLLKEEERVVDILENLRNTNQISEMLFDKLKPMGSKPPRLYALVKVHNKKKKKKKTLRCALFCRCRARHTTKLGNKYQIGFL